LWEGADSLSLLQQISDHQQSRGYENGPRKGSRAALLLAADFYKEFFYLCFIGSVGFDDCLTDSSLPVSCSLQLNLVLVVRLAYTNYKLTVISRQKFFFISIHKPPASIRFAP
jgi:hypothetical protein